MTFGPSSSFSDRVHAEKYRLTGESFEEAMDRVAGALTTDHGHFERAKRMLRGMRFLPGGRVQAAAGAPKLVTPYNCFVAGRIEDSFVHGPGSIMDRAREAAATMRMGGGIGYDFSTLRPRGAKIRKLGSKSSGPVAFMDIFDAVCRCTASSGNRRGAQMGVLRVDHPDIVEFIQAKHNEDRLTGFNVSVGVTDEFMRAVEADEFFDLRWGGEVYDTVKARDLWTMIMRSTWQWAEPGVLFLDRINEQNNLAYCENIVATNPCGEQPLPPHGACLLGSFNLTAYLREENTDHVDRWSFDWDLLREDVATAVRMMDRVVDVAEFPLPEQAEEARSKRRMGLGVTGLANTGEALGFPYGSEGFLAFEAEVLEGIRDEAYRTSVRLAEELGAFPAFRAMAYLERPFIRTLPEEILQGIATFGIRNSHLLSIAPTGTISLSADNVSSGIEPVFAYETDRTVRTESGVEQHRLADWGFARGIRGRRATEVTPAEHLAVLATAQRYVDSSVSKTINLPEDISWDDFQGVYFDAWRAGCKGCTTYKPGKRAAVLVPADDDGPEGACRIDSETGRRECE